MNYIKLTIFLLILIIITLCSYLISLIIQLDDDSNRFTNYVILSCCGIFIFLMIGEAFIFQYKPKSRYLQSFRTILLILAILVLLYIIITQITHSLLDDNGSGKVPIIDPHDANWYRLKKISRIIEYITCIIIVIIQIIIGYKKKRNNIQIDKIESLIQNDKQMITSQDQQEDSINFTYMINTFESKNTKQQQAIEKLKNNNS